MKDNAFMSFLNSVLSKLKRYRACFNVWSSIFMYENTFISSFYIIHIVTLPRFIDFLTMDYNTCLLIYLTGLPVILAYGM